MARFPKKLPIQTRELTTEIELRTADSGTTLTFSASSEHPVDRGIFTEVLDHSEDAIRLERVANGAVPLLWNHHWDDPIGIVRDAKVVKRRLVFDAQFFETERAREVQTMIRGGLRNVSIGYRVHAVEEKDDDVYWVRDWEPYEVSIVSVPADYTVGQGRAAGAEMEVRVMSNTTTAAQARDEVRGQDEERAGASDRVDVLNEGIDPIALERDRKESIRNICVANRLDESYARAWIQSGANIKQVTEQLRQILAERDKIENPVYETKLDLTRAEKRRYSVLRAINAAIANDWSNAGLELECNKELMKRLDRMPRSAKSFFVPLDVQTRDMTAAGVSGSQYLVSTENLAGSFIELLRNASVALRLGVERLTGLRGNVTIPRMTAGNTAYWLADETTQITESQPTLGQLSLTPKNVAAITDISHQLLAQSSPDAEALVMQSIARDIALAVDVAILRGTGTSGQPTGIITTAGIGSFTGTSLGATGVLEAIEDVTTANVTGPGLAFATHPGVARLLMARPELPSTGTTRLWTGQMTDGAMFGYPAISSAQMQTATMLFGWWPSVVLGEWGVLELTVNPFSDFTRGLTAVRGWYTVDVGVRYPAAWTYATSIT